MVYSREQLMKSRESTSTPGLWEMGLSWSFPRGFVFVDPFQGDFGKFRWLSRPVFRGVNHFWFLGGFGGGVFWGNLPRRGRPWVTCYLLRLHSRNAWIWVWKWGPHKFLGTLSMLRVSEVWKNKFLYSTQVLKYSLESGEVLGPSHCSPF